MGGIADGARASGDDVARTTASARGARLLALAANHPHAALLAVVCITLVTEPAVQAGRDDASSVEYLGAALGLAARAAVAALGLFVAWKGQERLRLPPVLACAGALGVGWLLVHLLVGVDPDQDLYFYAEDARALLDGIFPSSDYPTGAVLLFTAETWLGGEPPRVLHALVMTGFHLASVAAIWSLRTRWSGWLAAFVAVWPLNAFHWELRYDLAPTALLLVGLALAFREHWALAGAAFGIGAALKWSPALAFVVLVAWLLARGDTRAVLRHALAFGISFAVLTIPFLVWQPAAVIDTYEFQGDRGINGESLWYLVLAPLGLATQGATPSADAGASAFADGAATVLLLAVGATLVFLATRLASARQAVAVAALAPAAFLLTNRVFSSQFLVLLLAVWAVTAALVVRSAREQLAIAGAAAGASFANALVHPYTLPFGWAAASLALFALALGLTAWLGWQTLERDVPSDP